MNYNSLEERVESAMTGSGCENSRGRAVVCPCWLVIAVPWGFLVLKSLIAPDWALLGGFQLQRLANATDWGLNLMEHWLTCTALDLVCKAPKLA